MKYKYKLLLVFIIEFIVFSIIGVIFGISISEEYDIGVIIRGSLLLASVFTGATVAIVGLVMLFD